MPGSAEERAGTARSDSAMSVVLAVSDRGWSGWRRILGRHAGTELEIVADQAHHHGTDAQEPERPQIALQEPDGLGDRGVLRESVELGLVRVLEDGDHSRAADTGRVVEAGAGIAVGLELLHPLH